MKRVTTSKEERCLTHSKYPINVSLIVTNFICFQLYGHALCYHLSTQLKLLNAYVVPDLF